MKNKNNRFGYLEDVDISKFIKVNPNLRGCNDIDGDALTSYPGLVGEIDINSYSYKRVLDKSDIYFIETIYNQIITVDVISQFEDALLNNGGVICRFDDYEVPNLTTEDIMDNVAMIMKYRGYNVKKEDFVLQILNTPIGTEFEDMKIFATIKINNTIKHIEEMLYRVSAEILDKTSQYSEINTDWQFKKSLLAGVNPEHSDIVESSYFALKLYGFITNVFEEYTPGLIGEELMKIQRSNSAIMNNLLNELIIDARGEDSINLEDTYRELEKEIDSYFTSDMKLAVCPNVTQDLRANLFGQFFKCDTPKPDPVSLDFTVDFETKSFTFNKKLAGIAFGTIILSIILYIMVK